MFLDIIILEVVLMDNKFKGIIPALLTPFKENGDINKESLRELIRLNLKKGVTGFYIGGSTGEGFLMSVDERKELLEMVVDEVNKKASIIVQVGALSTADACKLTKHAELCEADAVSSVAPFYYQYSFEEIKKYYLDIAKSTDLPVIIYNFPKFSNVTLTPTNAKSFFNEQFIGIKHTSNDFFALERFKKIREDILVFNGYDEMFLSGLIAGADGGIGSTYNFMAEKFIKILDYFEGGQIQEAQIIQKEVNDIIEKILQMGIIQAEKEILSIMGIDMGVCREPFKHVNDQDKKVLKDIVKNLL